MGTLVLHPLGVYLSSQCNTVYITTYATHTRIESQGGRSPAWSRPGCALLRSLGFWHWYCAARVDQVHLETSWGLTVGSDGYQSRQPSSYSCIPHLLSAPPPSLTTFFISPHLRTPLAPPSTNRGFGYSPFRAFLRASSSDLFIPYGVLPLLNAVDFDVIFVCSGTTTGTARTSSKANIGSGQKVCRCLHFGFSNLTWI